MRYNLEQALADWRRQMFAAGFKDHRVLDELESHLREEIDQREQAGEDAAAAFAAASRQIGQCAVLKSEFAKIGEMVGDLLKRLFCTFAGIPSYQLALNMNTSHQQLEPGWATYLKSAALIVPALFIWVGSCVFVVPKLKEICVASGTVFPGPVLLALNISDLVKNNFIIGSVVFLAALIWLEWRSKRWPRYRRMVLGMAAFALNFIGLVLASTMMFFAVLAAANLLQK